MQLIMEHLEEVDQRLKNEKSRRMFERYQTVRLHLLGKDYADIAISIGRKESTVKSFLKKCYKDGLDGL